MLKISAQVISAWNWRLVEVHKTGFFSQGVLPLFCADKCGGLLVAQRLNLVPDYEKIFVEVFAPVLQLVCALVPKGLLKFQVLLEFMQAIIVILGSRYLNALEHSQNLLVLFLVLCDMFFQILLGPMPAVFQRIHIFGQILF